jgi:hypothetical protein
MATFKSQYLQSLHRSVQLETEFGRLSDLLTAHRVEFIPIKGIVLAHTVYSDPATRPMSDIDILVTSRQLPLIDSVMNEAGYRHDPDAADVSWTETKHHLCPWKHARSGIVVELHVRLLEEDAPVQDSADSLWERSVRGTWNGKEIRSLSPEDATLYSACHLLTHRSFRILTFLDLMKIIHRWKMQVDPTRLEMLQHETTMGLIARAALERFQVSPAEYAAHRTVETAESSALSDSKRGWEGRVAPSTEEAPAGQDESTLPLMRDRTFGEICALLENGALPPAQTTFTSTAAMSNTQAAYWRTRGNPASRCAFLFRYIMRILFPPVGWMRGRYKISFPLLDIFILYTYRIVTLSIHFVIRGMRANSTACTHTRK